MSIRLGRIMGIPIRVHYTLWLVFLLITWSLATGYMPLQYPGLPSATYWIIGLVSALLLFLSVLLHELSHSYIAKTRGLPVGRITLFFFGGVSEIAEEPQNPDLELKMAAAGPAFSFLFAALLAGLWYVADIFTLPIEFVATLRYGSIINALLGGFNMLPAFPLDGGRIFRAALWKRTKDLLTATRTASKVGVGFAYFMMFGGFVIVFFGAFIEGLWIIFLGWFLKSGAESSLSQTIIGDALSQTTVGDIMTTNVQTVDPDATINDIAMNYFLVYKHGGYPVVKEEEILGIITMQDIKQVPREKWSEVRVRDVMAPIEKLVMVRPETAAADALYKMAKYGVGRILIVKEGKLLGILTRGDLTHVIKAKTELGI